MPCKAGSVLNLTVQVGPASVALGFLLEAGLHTTNSVAINPSLFLLVHHAIPADKHDRGERNYSALFSFCKVTCAV